MVGCSHIDVMGKGVGAYLANTGMYFSTCSFTSAKVVTRVKYPKIAFFAFLFLHFQISRRDQLYNFKEVLIRIKW